ncbi:SCO family protein [Craterilacuibacter sinensis]|uniref:Redoxin domain-containing protein n=1 Tax=Craterilacuibacter sinensis TaxID=2686017 RepID=A0A845BMT3_9NEIS|nr:SCO family protein [Craterilacuibacter sinensis]MXR37692.1 redoxin domain-containing protein [Craterilacuibacter sinensis]
MKPSALLPLLLALALSACSPTPAPLPFKGSDISGETFGGELTLNAHTGQRVSLADYKGKVVALFFGYTHCPDICPTTLLEYAAAMKTLGKDSDQVQVLFVSVDAKRDTPAVLAGYVPHFNPRFIGLSGSAAELAAVATRFRIVSQVLPTEGGGYLIDHSAGSYLLDKTGRLRVYQPYGTPADALAHDIRLLLD